MSCGLHHDTYSEEQGGGGGDRRRRRWEEAAVCVDAAGKEAVGGGGRMWRKVEKGGGVEKMGEVHCIVVGERKYIAVDVVVGVAGGVFEAAVVFVVADAVAGAVAVAVAAAAFGGEVALVVACHPHEVGEPQLPQTNGQAHPLRQSCNVQTIHQHE